MVYTSRSYFIIEESQDRTSSRRLKQKVWRVVLAPTQAHTLLAGSHTGSHTVVFLYIFGPQTYTLLAGSHTGSHTACWLTHRLTHYPLAHTQAHTLAHTVLAASHTGSHTVGFVYISGLPAQGIVWLTVAWAFLLQLMIKTLSQRCTLGQIWSGQSLTETRFSSDCVELSWRLCHRFPR